MAAELAQPWLCEQEVVQAELLSEMAQVREVEMLFVEERQEVVAVVQVLVQALALLLGPLRPLLADHEYSLR